MKFIPILILSIFLIGCATPKRERTITIVEPAKVVNIAPEALKECNLLEENVVITTFEDAVIAYTNVVTAYGTCANKQTSSIKLLKQFGNIK